METRAVSISRSLAAGGEEIGQQVAKELGFRYVDHEIVTRAAVLEGVSPDTMGKVEHSRSLIDRIVQSLSSTSVLEIEGQTITPYIPSYDIYQHIIQEVIHETAQQGRVVIVAHGSSIPLAHMRDVLRVFITAPPEVRVQRHVSEAQLDERQAKRAIDFSDRERRNFFRRFYNVREELPTQYDLVVNTDRLTISDATMLIVSAAKRS